MRLDPQLEPKPPTGRPLPVNFFICQIQAHPITRSKPAMADLDRTTKTRDTWLSSAAQLRAPPRLPHFTFASSDLKRREPPGKTARSSAEDRGSIFARLAPAVDRDAQPAPRSRPERWAEIQRARAAPHLQRATVHRLLSRKVWRFGGFITPHQPPFCKTDTSIDYPLNIRRLC